MHSISQTLFLPLCVMQLSQIAVHAVDTPFAANILLRDQSARILLQRDPGINGDERHGSKRQISAVWRAKPRGRGKVRRVDNNNAESSDGHRNGSSNVSMTATSEQSIRFQIAQAFSEIIAANSSQPKEEQYSDPLNRNYLEDPFCRSGDNWDQEFLAGYFPDVVASRMMHIHHDESSETLSTKSDGSESCGVQAAMHQHDRGPGMREQRDEVLLPFSRDQSHTPRADAPRGHDPAQSRPPIPPLIFHWLRSGAESGARSYRSSVSAPLMERLAASPVHMNSQGTSFRSSDDGWSDHTEHCTESRHPRADENSDNQSSGCATRNSDLDHVDDDKWSPTLNWALVGCFVAGVGMVLLAVAIIWRAKCSLTKSSSESLGQKGLPSTHIIGDKQRSTCDLNKIYAKEMKHDEEKSDFVLKKIKGSPMFNDICQEMLRDNGRVKDVV